MGAAKGMSGCMLAVRRFRALQLVQRMKAKADVSARLLRASLLDVRQGLGRPADLFGNAGEGPAP